MGINGLLKGLSPLLIPVNEPGKTSNSSKRRSSTTSANHNVRQFKNKTLAIDASSWLFKASYSTAARLAESIETNHIDPVCEKALCKYMIKRCEELLTHAGIKRIHLVFDGKRCPMKAATNLERESKRRKNLAEARRLNQLGMRDQALDKYRACVKVTPWMAHSVAKAVAQRWKSVGGFLDARPKVECVFSPYEADAQLAKLCVDGLADAVVTEDSDILVYSAACNVSFPIIYKLDRDTGNCDVISMEWLLTCGMAKPTSQKQLDDDSRMGYSSLRRLLPTQSTDANDKNAVVKKGTKPKKAAGGALLSHLVAMASREARKQRSGARMFVQACVLAGCDYAPSQLSGVGLVTAFKTIKENAHRDPHSRFLYALRSFPADKMLSNDNTVPGAGKDVTSLINEYEELLAKSECVFHFHRVLDRAGNIVPLVPQRNTTDITGENNQLDDFIPSTDRFGDDGASFIGDLNANKNHQITELVGATQSYQSNVQTPSSSSLRRLTQNPYHKKLLSVEKPASHLSSSKKTNMFSFYAHKSKTVTSPPSAPKRKAPVPLRSPEGHNEKSLPQTEVVTLDSSNDEIDDLLLEPIAGISRKKPKVQTPTSPFLSTSSSIEQTVAARSRYFFSQAPIQSCVEKDHNTESEFIRNVTPTAADLQSKLEYPISSSHSASEYTSPVQYDSSASSTRRESKKILVEESSDEDDDDCIIIEEAGLTSRNGTDSYPTSQVPGFPRTGRFSSSFAKAQREGTRSRFASHTLSSKTKKSLKKNKALGSTTNRAHNVSIKGFFDCLPKRK
jgi:exonuclease-1